MKQWLRAAAIKKMAIPNRFDGLSRSDWRSQNAWITSTLHCDNRGSRVSTFFIGAVTGGSRDEYAPADELHGSVAMMQITGH